MNFRKIYYSLPPDFRYVARKLYYFPTDFVAKVSGKKNELEPDKGDIYIGTGDFISGGKIQLQNLIDFIQLNENDNVLDIGSGIGRTAVPLTGFLKNGKYEGFDVVKKGVDWCNEKIKKKYPHFNFTFIPLHNDLYNSFKTSSVNFTFPYEDKIFDKIFLFSVFTHMKINEIQHYLKEIQRVIKEDGKCLATFFLYDEKTEDRIATLSDFNFPFAFSDGYRLMDKKVHGANIAISKILLQNMVDNAGLEIEKIEEGFWKRLIPKEKAPNFQDIVIIKNKKYGTNS